MLLSDFASPSLPLYSRQSLQDCKGALSCARTCQASSARLFRCTTSQEEHGSFRLIVCGEVDNDGPEHSALSEDEAQEEAEEEKNEEEEEEEEE